MTRIGGKEEKLEKLGVTEGKSFILSFITVQSWGHQWKKIKERPAQTSWNPLFICNSSYHQMGIV